MSPREETGGRGRPPKTLVDLIRDNSFRRDRHRDLLETERLPKRAPEWADPLVWEKFCWAQTAYLDERWAGIRHDFVKAFSRGFRAMHGGRLPWLLGGP